MLLPGGEGFVVGKFTEDVALILSFTFFFLRIVVLVSCFRDAVPLLPLHVSCVKGNKARQMTDLSLYYM